MFHILVAGVLAPHNVEDMTSEEALLNARDYTLQMKVVPQRCEQAK
jgi:hypothetical protein